MSDPLDAIRQVYFQECEELLQAMEEGLLALDGGSADNEAVHAVFRAVHSIKGGGGAFGFEGLVRFAHGFETVLDMLRAGRLACDGQTTQLLLRAGDMLADHVAAARDGKALAPAAGADIATALAELSGADDDGAGAPADFEGLDFTPVAITVDAASADSASVDSASVDSGAGDPGDSGGWHIRFAPAAGLYAHANEPALLMAALAELGALTVRADLSALPPLAALDPCGAFLAWEMELTGVLARAAVEEVFDFVTGDCALTITPLTGEAPPALPLPELPELPLPALPLPEAAPETVGARKDSVPEVPRPSIRVDLEKVDRLVNLVGEMVIAQAVLSQRVSEVQLPRATHVAGGLAELEHLLRALQESVMAIRTQPVKSVFQRMPRLVRELAAQTGKKVRLVVEGEATEVDKTVIERLGEPLTHIIRNAVDHGLETPEERLAAGKPEEGTVRLMAEHRGGRIVIAVSDDGCGIDRARVRAKALEKGLIAPAATLSDEETDNLIFLPGFSTAREVSSISGRGVGMDVVRRNIVDLGGRIVIASQAGQGSRFSLTLPLTLAVLDGMVVSIAGQTFVLPLTHIVESLQPRPGDVRPFGPGRSLLNVRGVYVPLVMTGALLGLAGAAPSAPHGISGVAILVESQGSGRMALLVDAILGQRQVVVKSVESNYRPVAGIAAATILGDGRVALILDVDGIVARCRAAFPATADLQPTGS